MKKTFSLHADRLSPKAQSAIKNYLTLQYDALDIHELEKVLRDNIKTFRDKPGKKHGTGYRALETAIEIAIYHYLENRKFLPDVIEKVIDKRVPSHTYIRNFNEGQSICINYMNTLAFFFGIKYLISNFEFKI